MSLFASSSLDYIFLFSLHINAFLHFFLLVKTCKNLSNGVTSHITIALDIGGQDGVWTDMVVRMEFGLTVKMMIKSYN